MWKNASVTNFSFFAHSTCSLPFILQSVALAIFAKHSKLNKKHNTTYILEMILSV